MPKKKLRRGENKKKIDLVKKIQPDTISKILASASAKYYLPIMFAVGTGLRAGEQRALRWDNVDLDKGRIKVREAMVRAETKSGFSVGDTKTVAGERIVPIGGKLLIALKEWKLAQPASQRSLNLVFPSSTGAYADGDNWRKRGLYAACDKAEVERIRWHDLRHHYASILLDRFGENLSAVAFIMGHENIETTNKIYGHWMENEKRDDFTGEELARAIFG